MHKGITDAVVHVYPGIGGSLRNGTNSKLLPRFAPRGFTSPLAPPPPPPLASAASWLAMRSPMKAPTRTRP